MCVVCGVYVWGQVCCWRHICVFRDPVRVCWYVFEMPTSSRTLCVRLALHLMVFVAAIQDSPDPLCMHAD